MAESDDGGRASRSSKTCEKPLRLDMGFEEAIQRFMKAPPMPKEERLRKVGEGDKEKRK